jgi:hypothetical protein
MPTSLFLRTTSANPVGSFLDMIPVEGSSNLGLFVSTIDGPAEIQWCDGAGVTPVEWIGPRAPAGGFTLAGLITFNIRANEANPNQNSGVRVRLYKRTWAGVETEIANSPFDYGSELPTDSSISSYTATPTSTVFAEDDRLVARIFTMDAGGVMTPGFNTLSVDGNSGSPTHNSYIQINETVAFKAEGDPDGSHVGGSTSVSSGIGRGIGMGIGRGMR